MNALEILVNDIEKCDELLAVLDEIARDVDHYEYGLPLYDDSVKARLREAMYHWAAGALNKPEAIQQGSDA